MTIRLLELFEKTAPEKETGMVIEPSLCFSFLFAELLVFSQILGHSSIKTTQIYAKITLKKLDKDFSVFNDNVMDAFF